VPQWKNEKAKGKEQQNKLPLDRFKGKGYKNGSLLGGVSKDDFPEHSNKGVLLW